MKKNIFKTITIGSITICTILGIILFVNATYANNSYTIIFNRAENNQIMKTCTTGNDGKLIGDCIDVISKICNKWSTQPWYGNNYQENQINVSAFSDMVFTSDTNYYCVAGSSLPTSSKVACFVCNDDKNIMKWHVNGNSDENCSSGYTKVDTPESQCKTIIPDSCYVCNNDNNVMKWDNNGNSDNNCSSGYTKADTPESQCKTINNPQTGNTLITIVYIIGISTICYSIYYFKKVSSNKK